MVSFLTMPAAPTEGVSGMPKKGVGGFHTLHV